MVLFGENKYPKLKGTPKVEQKRLCQSCNYILFQRLLCKMVYCLVKTVREKAYFTKYFCFALVT